MSGNLVGERARPGQATTSRRVLVALGAKLVGGSAMAALPVGGMVRGAAAQDDSVILVAGAAEIGASPGSAFARSAAAEAAAARGAARVQSAAALAKADSDDGAITQSPVAFAAADPDQGAVAQSAVAVASASSQDDDDRDGAFKAPAKAIAPARGGRRAGGGGGRGGGRGMRRAMRVGRGGGGRDRAGRRDRVGRLPSAGIGSLENGPLASLFAAASAAAGLGAVLLRRQATPEVAAQPVIADD